MIYMCLGSKAISNIVFEKNYNRVTKVTQHGQFFKMVLSFPGSNKTNWN